MCDLLEHKKGKRRVSRSKKTCSSLKKERNLELDEILGKENAKKKRNVGQDFNYIFSWQMISNKVDNAVMIKCLLRCIGRYRYF